MGWDEAALNPSRPLLSIARQKKARCQYCQVAVKSTCGRGLRGADQHPLPASAPPERALRLTHALSQPCHACGEPTPAVQLDLDYRIEYLSVRRHDGQPQTQVNIQSCELIAAYCSKDCWEAGAEAWAAILELTTTYPPIGFVTSCCQCASSVDRTQPYICYSISKMAYPEGGGDVVICKSARNWAVLCNACDKPTGPPSAAIVRDIDAPVREFS